MGYPKYSRLPALLAALLFSFPAWATWDGTTTVANTSASSLSSSTLTFESAGQTLPVTVAGDDEDGNAILVIGYTGDSAAAGTLTIDGPNGKKFISMPAAANGENIVIDPSGPGSARRQTALPPSTRPLSVDWPKHRISISGGYMEADGTKAATAGIVVPSSGSEFANLYSPNIEMTGGRLAYQYNSGLSLPSWIDPKGHSRNLTFGIGYTDYSGDNSASATTASGGAGTGFLYTRDLSGSTGVFAGAAGLVSQSTVDADYNRLDLSMGWPCVRDWGRNVRVSPIASFAYTNFDYEIDSLDTFDPNLFPPDQYFDHRVQNVNQDIYELGLGARVQKILGASGRFDVFSDFSARLYYNDAKLTSAEQIVIAGAPEQINYSTKESDTSIGADIGVGAGWNFGKSFRVEAVANYVFNAPIASVKNPTMGNVGRPPLELDLDGEDRWQANVQLSYGFGR